MVLNLTRALSRTGVSTVMGVLSNPSGLDRNFVASARGIGLDVIEFPCRGRLDSSLLRKLREHTRAAKFDVVHSHGYKADIYSICAFRDVRCCLVATCHNWTTESLRVRFNNALDMLALRRFDRNAAVSEKLCDQLLKLGISHKNVRFIPNGIEVEQFFRSPARKPRDNGFRFGVVGRLSPEKGQAVLLDAISDLAHRGFTFSLEIVGEGPQRQMLEQKVEGLGIQQHVVFRGRQDDMPAVYSELDCLMLPSLDEGMPMVLLEAAASRVPIVASDVGAVSKIVRHEHSGLLVNAGDPTALASAMQKMIEDEISRITWTENALECVCEKFSSSAMAAQYISLYQSAHEK